jgi:hypothetical protein
MAFFKLDDVEDLEAYKKSRSASLSRISDKPVSFIYSKKHTFKLPQKKVQPLFVFENGKVDSGVVKAIRAAGGPIAEGSCFKNKEGVLVFEMTKGDLDGFDMVPKFQIAAAGAKPPEASAEAKAAALPPPAAAPAAKPEAPKPPEAKAPVPQAPSAPAPAPAAEPEDESKDFKVRLANGLKKIKTTNGKESLAFVACVAKPFYGVLFAKSATESIGPAHKKLLTELVQGTKFIIGTCLFEENAFTFIVDPVPPGLAKNLKAAFKQFLGLMLKVRVRDTAAGVVTDGDTERDPQEPAAPGAAPASAPSEAKATPPPAPPPPAAKPAAAKMPPPAAVPEQGKVREVKLSTYLSGRAKLREAREAAERGLNQLREAILAKSKDEPFYGEVETKSQRLFDFLVPIDESVANKLDEAGRCLDPEQQVELNKQVRVLIQKQLGAMRAHPLSSCVERNPFGAFVIKQPLETTLSALETQLS